MVLVLKAHVGVKSAGKELIALKLIIDLTNFFFSVLLKESMTSIQINVSASKDGLETIAQFVSHQIDLS